MKRRGASPSPDRRASRRAGGALTGGLPIGYVPPSERDLHPDEEARRLEELIVRDAELDQAYEDHGRALERADAITDQGYRPGAHDWKGPAA